MKNAPLMMATGLVAVLAGGVAAVTRDQWLPATPLAITVPVTVAVEKPVVTEARPVAPKPPETKLAVAVVPVKPAVPVVTKPVFDTVRVEKSGEAIIAGSADPGSIVLVKLDGATIGEATANAEGAFVIIPDKPLPAGSGALSIEEKKKTGEIVASDQTIAVAVPEAAKPAEAVVALITPDAPVKIIQTPAKPAKADALALDVIDYNDAGDILFKGKAAANAALRLYVGNALLADLVADNSGNWSFDGQNKVAAGTHALRIDQLDAKGAVARRIELPFTREAPEIVLAAKVEDLPPPVVDVAKTPETVAAILTPAKPKDGRVVIQPGNNLWKLSRVIYGKGKQYTLIYDANKEGIKDPRLIYPGQILSIPNVVPPEKIDPARKLPLTVDEGGAALQ